MVHNVRGWLNIIKQVAAQKNKILCTNGLSSIAILSTYLQYYVITSLEYCKYHNGYWYMCIVACRNCSPHSTAHAPFIIIVAQCMQTHLVHSEYEPNNQHFAITTFAKAKMNSNIVCRKLNENIEIELTNTLCGIAIHSQTASSFLKHKRS